MTDILHNMRFKCPQCSERECWAPVVRCLNCGEISKIIPPKIKTLGESETKSIEAFLDELWKLED